MTIDLFTWWAISISWSIAFLISAGFYLYSSSRARHKEDTWKENKRKRNRERLIEVGTFAALETISMVGAFAQTLWWLLPGCIFFLLAVLAVIERQREQSHRIQLKAKAKSIAKNFIFVWILLALLVFYIFTVQLGTGTLSELVFALGNIIVEILLIFYLFRNRDKKRRSP